MPRTPSITPWRGNWHFGDAMRFLADLRKGPLHSRWTRDAIDMALVRADSTGTAVPLAAARPPHTVAERPLGLVLAFSDNSALALRRDTHGWLRAPAHVWFMTRPSTRSFDAMLEAWTPDGPWPTNWTAPFSGLDHHTPWSPSIWAPRGLWEPRVAAAQASRRLLLKAEPTEILFLWERQPLEFLRASPDAPIALATHGGIGYGGLGMDAAQSPRRRMERLLAALECLFPNRLGFAAQWSDIPGTAYAGIAPTTFLHLPAVPRAPMNAHARLAARATIAKVCPAALAALAPPHQDAP